MTALRSLGISKPAGLSYLLAEGTSQLKISAASWSCVGEPGDELLVSEARVIWTRYGVIHRILTFDVEREKIVSALFAEFPQQPVKSHDVDRSQAKPSIQPDPSVSLAGSSGRALVVLLKTQAHVYFVGGSTHVVNLPFEVQAAWSTPFGLILQRALAVKPITISLHAAKTPANSFAPSLLAPSLSPESRRTHTVTRKADPFYAAFFKPASTCAERPSHKGFPHHAYLRDPLTEVGIIGEVVAKKTSQGKQREFSQFFRLPSEEEIVYISSTAEVSSSHVYMAVTYNSALSQHTIWEIVETPDRVSLKRRRKVDYYLESRRRSSHGLATGTTTPRLQVTSNKRESFGAFNENRNVKSRKQKSDAELVNQLDAAFEGGNVTTQSSRRISSLLARSELAIGNDATGLTDPMPIEPKHGVSSIGAGVRTSFGPVTRSFGRKSGRHSYYDLSLQDLPSQDASDNSMDTESESEKISTFAKASRSLQQDIAFVKIHSRAESDDPAIARSYVVSSRPKVVVLPTPMFTDESNIKGLALYIHDARLEKVHCTNIDIITSTPSSQRRSDGYETLRYRSTEVVDNVVDMCKVGDLRSTSLVMLIRSKTNEISLWRHFPWSQPERLELPLTFLRRNPFQIGVANPAQQHREGSLRRVLSEGIDQLSGLRALSLPDQFDVSDSKGVWHRLNIQSGPKDKFVQKLLRLCQRVLEGSRSTQKDLYRMWSSIKRWQISAKLDAKVDDWRTFLILISSVFATYLPPRAKASSSRAKRKTGLLRSSSGAQIDTESFDAMILLENKLRNSGSPWLEDPSWSWTSEHSISTSHNRPQKSPMFKRIGILQEALHQARDFLASNEGKEGIVHWTSAITGTPDVDEDHKALTSILAALHLIREEEKLHILHVQHVQALTPLLAQIGGWLGCTEWDWREMGFYNSDCVDLDRWDFDVSTIEPLQAARPLIPPPAIFEHIEEVLHGNSQRKFSRLGDLPNFDRDEHGRGAMRDFTPRTLVVLEILGLLNLTAGQVLSNLASRKWDWNILETLPEGIAVSLRSVLNACQASPPSQLSRSSFSLIGREDLAELENRNGFCRMQGRSTEHVKHESSRDYHQAVSNTLMDSDDVGPYDENAEMDRSNITRLVFSADQRFAEAARLVHPLKPSLARCESEPDWTDQELLEAQQELAKIVAYRTLSVSSGRAMLFYNARHPLLTERFPIHGFSLTTLMKPSNITVAADRTAYTEDKVSWAFFHAGVEAGLTISRTAKGIDTSWILFNKPKESGDRHAGFLLGLGLNGHLRTIAKWVAFKYLTPKHTMTSIGLLLGLAASHIGSMDDLITRILSVHVTRMLPPGAAELNVSPLTQTTGIMAVGILYYKTEHRRMTEIMLSEIESVEQEEGANPAEDLRDEGYRLAAGFALGYINLGQGRKTKGLGDMKIIERLSSLVAATREISLVHILDKATAGAVVAIALIFLKTGDRALANKIDIPETILQFEYVRPDMFLLRTVARHLIMWDMIQPAETWMKSSLPRLYQKRIDLKQIRALHTEDLPLYNILAGLCLAIGLRFAGSAREDARDLLITYLDQFIRINKLPALHYDAKLTKVTTRNCQDVVVLASAAIMAGTGDIKLLRRYRSLHGRTTPDTPYGSHLAAHQAIGLLFLGGGTHTLSTSNLAVASMLCSFYPLFPSHVQDNKAHLQAFRHFWVFAAEARCLVVRDTRTSKPLSLDVVVVSKAKKCVRLTAPCLLPELNTISKIYSADHRFWEVALDFENNPHHLNSFKQHQSMFVKRKGPNDTNSGAFASMMQTLNDRQLFKRMQRQNFEWVFGLSSLSELDQGEWTVVLPGELSGFWNNTGKTTVVDDRLALEKECILSSRTDRLWSIRLLFAWADYASKTEAGKGWLGRDVIEAMKARIAIMQQG